MRLLKNIPAIDTYLADIEVAWTLNLYYMKKTCENGGFRSIIAMVGDMMIRLFKSQPTITNPSELAGIVIIDELDLHWHPKMQREIPQLLSKIFPKVQFIAIVRFRRSENSVLLK